MAPGCRSWRTVLQRRRGLYATSSTSERMYADRDSRISLSALRQAFRKFFLSSVDLVLGIPLSSRLRSFRASIASDDNHRESNLSTFLVRVLSGACMSKAVLRYHIRSCALTRQSVNISTIVISLYDLVHVFQGMM